MITYFEEYSSSHEKYAFLCARFRTILGAVTRADGWWGSHLSAPSIPSLFSSLGSLLRTLHAPSFLETVVSFVGFHRSLPAGKRVLLVDVRTEEEMGVSMLRGAVTRRAIPQSFCILYRASPNVPQNGDLQHRLPFTSHVLCLCFRLSILARIVV